MRLYASAKLGISNTVSWGARVLKSFGAPLATKFTYKMRSGGKGMWGRGPALYKQKLKKKKKKKSIIYLFASVLQFCKVFWKYEDSFLTYIYVGFGTDV